MLVESQSLPRSGEKILKQSLIVIKIREAKKAGPWEKAGNSFSDSILKVGIYL